MFAKVSKRLDVPLLRRINSLIFYLIASKMTGNFIPKSVSDFRLLSKRCYQKLFRLEEVNPVQRGLGSNRLAFKLKESQDLVVKAKLIRGKLLVWESEQPWCIH